MNLLISTMVVAFGVNADPVPQLPKAMKPDEFLKQCEAQEKALFEYFSNEKVWDRKSRDMTVSQLAVVAKLRPMSVLPILFKNILYLDNIAIDNNISLSSLEEAFPVYGTLDAYGSLAHPALFEHLRSFKEYKQTNDSEREDHFYYRLIRGPYYDEKLEVNLAVKTIQNEIDKKPFVQFPRLLAIQNYAESCVKKEK